MNSKSNILILATGILFLFSCNNNSSTTDKDKYDSNQSQMTTDNMDRKMTGADTTKKMGNGMMGSMNGIMEKMDSMKMSGNFDLDFANMMIEHHQGAIDMSQEELKSGKNEKLKAMAQNIITNQTAEQSKLRGILKTLTPMKMDMDKHDELRMAMTEMKENMKAMQISGTQDKDYAMMMIPHHASAIKMFTAELSHGMNAELKKIAKQGIADQSKEISEFKNSMSGLK